MNRRHLAALLLVPALALTAACGGGDDGADPKPTASAQPTAGDRSSAPGGSDAGDSSQGGAKQAPGGVPSSAPAKVVNAFVACMREHGVKVPENTSTWQPDAQDGRTQKALIACMKAAGAPAS
ncbi:hypothetical protein [Actinomadura latina]|uniref:Lipoprotein n=1 Tax=Actinomadura latina TaxID=163603 RepID=A0A846Z940_9ACTN|nr:hypothetical protein [Actinomadura latina]NKZ08961.1 hypothetical protein [Actinomadura latina]